MTYEELLKLALGFLQDEETRTMTFRGVKLIKPIQVDRPGTRLTELYFDNMLDHPTREAWQRAGYPVYYEAISNKNYIIVDRKEILYDTVPVSAKCECGAEKVGASRHSTWCGRYE
jgi:hypothetical protein